MRYSDNNISITYILVQVHSSVTSGSACSHTSGGVGLRVLGVSVAFQVVGVAPQGRFFLNNPDF